MSGALCRVPCHGHTKLTARRSTGGEQADRGRHPADGGCGAREFGVQPHHGEDKQGYSRRQLLTRSGNGKHVDGGAAEDMDAAESSRTRVGNRMRCPLRIESWSCEDDIPEAQAMVIRHGERNASMIRSHGEQAEVHRHEQVDCGHPYVC